MTQPTTELDIAVVGAKGTIKVATADDLSGPQTCTFEVLLNPGDLQDSSSSLSVASSWKEVVTFSRAGYNIKKETVWVGEWIVGVDSPKSTIPDDTCFVRVSVGKNNSTARIPAMNEYRIPGFTVTEHQEMKSIMLHEFSRQTSINSGLADWSYDDAPLKEYIRKLTPQQRGLLCNYDERKLVVFISLRGVRTDYPMFMDNTPKEHKNRRQCSANADFALFRCSKRGHRVTLEVYTEYFCVNVNNGDSMGRDTPNFLNVCYGYMDPTTRRPWKLVLAAEPHESCVYISVINAFQAYDVQGTPIDPNTKKPQVGPDGKKVIVTTTIGVGSSIMAGNYIHGGINTKGCWPLFRNFNWPMVRRDQLFSIYVNDYRGPTTVEDIKLKLNSIGYDVPAQDNTPWSSSYDKAFVWDRNYAYTFFCKHVLGIDFYSRGKDGDRGPNLYQTHGHTQEVDTLTQEEKSFDTTHRSFPNAGDLDFFEKPENVPIIPNTVWKHNILDTPTATGWGLPFADCYLYNPGHLSLAKLKEDPFSALPQKLPLPL